MNADLSLLEERIGYAAKNRGLIVLALTHPSFAHEKNAGPAHNQRLEFLGDAVLQLVSSDYFYRSMPASQEGEMTRLRAAVVCEQTLVRVADAIGLGSFLLLGHGESLSGGAKNPSNLADAMEALLGAVYLDGGFEAASGVVQRLFTPYFTLALSGRLSHDYKSRLYEWAQSQPNTEITFRVLGESGPEHNRRFSIGLFLNGECASTAEGHTKKDAEQQASRIFLSEHERSRTGPAC